MILRLIIKQKIRYEKTVGYKCFLQKMQILMK